MFKKIFLFAIIGILFACGAQAQFFEGMKKPKSIQSFGVAAGKLTKTQIAETITEKMEFRPTINFVATGFQIPKKGQQEDPGVVVLTGGGITYGLFRYNSVTEKWVGVWQVNALAMISTRVSGKSMRQDFYGTTFGLWDNKLQGGFATNFQDVLFTINLGIPLNNL